MEDFPPFVEQAFVRARKLEFPLTRDGAGHKGVPVMAQLRHRPARDMRPRAEPDMILLTVHEVGQRLMGMDRSGAAGYIEPGQPGPAASSPPRWFHQRTRLGRDTNFAVTRQVSTKMASAVRVRLHRCCAAFR